MAGGIGLLVWAIAIVGTIDNFLRPILIERGIHMHPFVILLSVLGGLAFFGPLGFIAGPVLMALFFALAEIYPNIMKGTAIPETDKNDHP
jgi:predicted PurR-regulated permease PerM